MISPTDQNKPGAADYPLIDFIEPGHVYRVRKDFLYFRPGDEFRIMGCALGGVPAIGLVTINLSFPDMDALSIDVSVTENLDLIHEPEEFLQRRALFDWDKATEEFRQFLAKKAAAPR